MKIETSHTRAALSKLEEFYERPNDSDKMLRILSHIFSPSVMFLVKRLVFPISLSIDYGFEFAMAFCSSLIIDFFNVELEKLSEVFLPVWTHLFLLHCDFVDCEYDEEHINFAIIESMR